MPGARLRPAPVSLPQVSGPGPSVDAASAATARARPAAHAKGPGRDSHARAPSPVPASARRAVDRLPDDATGYQRTASSASAMPAP